MKLTVRYKGLQDVVTFGRWKGHTLQTVLDEDPDYILWIFKSVPDFPIESNIVDQALDFILNTNDDIEEMPPAFYKDDDDDNLR